MTVETYPTSSPQVRAFAEAGMIPEAARLSPADWMAVNELSADQVNAIIALRFSLGSHKPDEDDHVASVFV